jgi:hypothetical protein
MIANEHEDDKRKRKNMNPYERLGYIHSMALFHKNMGKDLTLGDLESFVDEIINLTKKYKESV